MSVTLDASSGSKVKSTPGLCRMQRRSTSVAPGAVTRCSREPAPADSPNTVTFEGSPPKAATLSWTQDRAAS